MAAYLSIAIESGMNIFVSGETASGKTTLMNAITVFIDPNAKIVSIEDTPEVQVPHPNWIREATRAEKPGEAGTGVDMFDLLKAALRQRPDEIIIGEIRGEEGLIANGIGLYWVVPVGGGALGAHELWGQVALGENEELFADGNRVIGLVGWGSGGPDGWRKQWREATSAPAPSTITLKVHFSLRSNTSSSGRARSKR